MTRWSDTDRRVARARIVDAYGPEGVGVWEYLRTVHEREGWT